MFFCGGKSVTVTVAAQEVWAQAVAVRKSLISLNYASSWKKSAVETAYKSSPVVSFVGELNKKFLLLHLAADLSFEDPCGWTHATACKNAKQLEFFKDKLAFVANVTGNTLGLIFDGRSREARKLREPEMVLQFRRTKCVLECTVKFWSLSVRWKPKD